MNAQQLVCVGAAAFVGSLLVTATVAVAKSPTRPVIIEKRLDPMTRHVSFADLSLTTKEGQDVLYWRVGKAVNEVCPPTLPNEDGASTYERGYCRDFAWHGARPQIRKAIRSAKNGTPLIMTLGVMGAQK